MIVLVNTTFESQPMSPEPIFIGIDPSGGREPFCFSALNKDCSPVLLEEGDLDRVLEFLSGNDAAIVAINAPQHPSQGLVKERLMKRGPSSGSLRGSDCRLAEYELHERGISVSNTPSRKEMCPSWVQLGFSLYEGLTGLPVKYEPYSADQNAHQFFETHPHAIFCSMLGLQPLPKPTLEGRLQRQLILHENGVKIHDPMAFFEEITRYRLLHGIMPMEILYSSEQLDSLAAAFTAFVVGTHPDQVIRLGDKTEGQIVLPVKELKERY